MISWENLSDSSNFWRWHERKMIEVNEKRIFLNHSTFVVLIDRSIEGFVKKKINIIKGYFQISIDVSIDDTRWRDREWNWTDPNVVLVVLRNQRKRRRLNLSWSISSLQCIDSSLDQTVIIISSSSGERSSDHRSSFLHWSIEILLLSSSLQSIDLMNKSTVHYWSM